METWTIVKTLHETGAFTYCPSFYDETDGTYRVAALFFDLAAAKEYVVQAELGAASFPAVR